VWALALLTLIAAFNTIDRQVVTILIAPMKLEFHLSDSQVGFIGLIYGVLFALGAPPLAFLAERTSRRAVIAACTAVFSASTMLCGLSINYVMVLLSRLGVGVGEAGTAAPSQSLIADAYGPKERTFALSIFSAASKPGGFIAFLAGGWLAQLYGWRATFVILGVPGFLIALLAWRFVREPTHASKASPATVHSKAVVPTLWETLGYLRHAPSFWHILLGQALWSLVALGLVFWTPIYLQRTFGLKLGAIGTAMAFYTLVAGTLGVVIIGWVCQKMQTRDVRWILGVLMIAAAAATPFVWGFLTTSSLWTAALCAILPVSMYTASLGPCSAATQALVPVHMRTVTLSFSQCFHGLLGMAVGPWLPGALSDAFQGQFGGLSLRYALLCFSLIWIWAVVHFYFANRRLANDIARADRYTLTHHA
jgi:MFS family permease